MPLRISIKCTIVLHFFILHFIFFLFKFDIVDGAYILPPILYPDGNYYLKLGHYNQFETDLPGHLKTITDWYEDGTGIPDAVKRLSDFIVNDFIRDPDIKFTDISSDCCVTVNVRGHCIKV